MRFFMTDGNVRNETSDNVPSDSDYSDQPAHLYSLSEPLIDAIYKTSVLGFFMLTTKPTIGLC